MIKKWFLLSVWVPLLFSCAAKKQTQSTSDSGASLTLEKLATYKSVEALLTAFPDSNPENGTAWFEEGTEERSYTTLYKNTPHEVLITWQNGRVYDVTIAHPGQWSSQKGIQIGTTYDQLVEINGGPIQVYGFGWDYGGAVDWSGGRLKNSGLQVYMAPENMNFDEKFYGDTVIQPTENELKTLKLRVAAIVYLP